MTSYQSGEGMETINEADWKQAETTKDTILRENKIRIQAIEKEQVEWAIKLKKREVEFSEYQMKLLGFRNEIAEIKKRNFALVREWVRVDAAYREQNPEKFAVKTLDELQEDLEKKGVKVDKWRLGES